MTGKLGVRHPLHGVVGVEEADDLARVRDVALHAHRQGLDPLEDVEGIGRTQTRAEVAQALGASAHDERLRPELLGVVYAMVAGVGLGQRREQAGSLPVETAAVDDHPADGDAMAAEELGQRVVHEVGAEIERAAQVRRGEGGIDQQRHAGLVSDLGDPGDVEHLEPGVAQRFAEEQSRIGPDRLAERLGLARIHEGGLDTEARQRMRKQVVRAAVDRLRRDDVAARPHERHQREVQRRLSARRAHRADAAFECRNAFLEHSGRRVGNAGVQMPGALEVEQRRRLVGVAEDVGRGLVDRNRARAVHRVGMLAGMQAQRIGP